MLEEQPIHSPRSSHTRGAPAAALPYMSYNQIKYELQQLEGRLDYVKKELARVVQECAAYDTFDGSEPPPFVDGLAELILDLEERVRRAAPLVQASTKYVTYLDKRASLGFDPRRWFSADRFAAVAELNHERKKLQQLSGEHQDWQKQLSEALSDRTRLLREHKKALEQHTAAVAAHARYDRAVAENAIAAHKKEIATLNARISPLRKRIEAIEGELAPHLAELSKATQERDQAQRREQRARRYEEQLNKASSARERREVHQQCEAELGDGSPSRVLTRERRILEPIGRRVTKIEERIRIITERASRQIDRVVIDGNNLCYPKRGRFGGVGALRAIAQASTIDAEIVVVFDASIRKHGFNESSLARAIGDRVRVHIVNGAADETVLDLASGPNEYVVSNDRFDEYRAKPAVAQRRIFRHEHISNRVLIHDLKIDATYE